MSLILVRKALDKRLVTLIPALAIASENAVFQPVSGATYYRVNLLPNTPDNSVMGSAVYFERGLLQVTVCAPPGTGPSAADTQAQAIRSHFKRGLSLTESGVTVNITDTPRISGGMPDGDRFSVPVTIAWQAQIQTP